MAKTILFDCWGTLVENGVRSPIKQVKEMLDIDLPFSEYVVRMERAMMTTKIENLHEAFEQVCHEFNISVDEQKIEQLVGMWNKNWMLAEPYDEVEEVLISLRKNHRLALIANTDCLSIKNVLDKFDLRKHFDNIFLSCHLGKIKTDRDFFPTILDELHASSDECVMVGDSIQSDIIPAKFNNIKAVLVDRRDTREFVPKITNLKELGNVLE